MLYLGYWDIIYLYIAGLKQYKTNKPYLKWCPNNNPLFFLLWSLDLAEIMHGTPKHISVHSVVFLMSMNLYFYRFKSISFMKLSIE